MKMENGHKDRVRLRQDGFQPGRQMGPSVMLCYSIYVFVCVYAQNRRNKKHLTDIKSSNAELPLEPLATVLRQIWVKLVAIFK